MSFFLVAWELEKSAVKDVKNYRWSFKSSAVDGVRAA
jgi:hypothetical protein